LSSIFHEIIILLYPECPKYFEIPTIIVMVTLTLTSGMPGEQHHCRAIFQVKS